jgi:hypothetical protein
MQFRQDCYLLSRFVLRDFHFFATNARQFMTYSISLHPDLGKEILVAIAVENQLGLLGSLHALW